MSACLHLVTVLSSDGVQLMSPCNDVVVFYAKSFNVQANTTYISKHITLLNNILINSMYWNGDI